MTKQAISELTAAAEFTTEMMQSAQATWSPLYAAFRKHFGSKFVVSDEAMATFDLALAGVSGDLQAVRNLFPKDQAERIEKWVFSLIENGSMGEYAAQEVKAYAAEFQNAIANISSGADPTAAIPARLLHGWLGKNIVNFEVQTNGRRTGFISPILIMFASEAMMPFIGAWKKIKDNFELFEEDLPFEIDFKALGLKDYDGRAERNPPDGTIILPDGRGGFISKWFPPEQLEELLSKTNARRVGTICRVLIKGPWQGVKEGHMQLTDELVQKYVDSIGHAYALCTYKKGNPEYALVKKPLWDNHERAIKVMMDRTLTEGQRTALLKDLATEP